jgi:hypothetical protein
VNTRAVQVVVLALFLSPVSAQTGTVRIRVTDAADSVIPSANSSLLAPNEQPVRTVTANEAGEIVWTNLPLGDSHFEVTSPGFKPRRLNVMVRNSDEQTVVAWLEVAGDGGGLHIVDSEEEVTIKTVQAPYPQTLGLPPASPPKPAKRRWWQIFF